METSLKQRLLGAAVLIALAIIFLPMLLTGPGPKPSSETANLQAPPTPDRRFQERTLSLDLPRPDAEPASTAPVANPDPNAIAMVDTATAPPSRQEPIVDVPATPAPAPAATVPTTPEPSNNAAASTAEPAVSLPGTAANGTYFVHLGDYGATKNAIDLAATLKKSGYPAFTESSTFGGKPTLRVRVGPFADRASAEAIRLKIGQTNVRAPASVVQNASNAKPSPEPDASTDPQPAPAAAAAPASARGWAVQLGAFATLNEADKLRDKLRAASFPAFVDKVNRDGQSLWRVRVGPQADRGSADATEARIRDRLKLDGVVVAHP